MVINSISLFMDVQYPDLLLQKQRNAVISAQAQARACGREHTRCQVP